MPFKSPLDKNGTPLHCYERPSGKLTPHNCLKHDDRTFISVENILKFFEFMVKDSLH